MLGAITRQVSRLSICSLRLKSGSVLTRAPTIIRTSGLTNPVTQQPRFFSVNNKQNNPKLLSLFTARPIVFRHYTTEAPSSAESKFEDDLDEEFEKEMASKLSSTQLSDYYYNKIANDLNLTINQVKNTAQLLKEENTIHFITRYRKEMTGGLSEHEVRDIEKKYNEFVKVEIRKQFIIESMTKRMPDKLTPEFRAEIQKADTMAVLEDLYAPYKQRKRNKATVARELGLGPLADSFLTESISDAQLDAKIKSEINPEKELTAESITEHITNILTETLTYHTTNIQRLRDMFNRGAMLTVAAAPKKKKKSDDPKSMDIDIPAANKKSEDVYETYYNFSKPIGMLRPYQTLAINRGEKEGFLKVKLDVADSSMISEMEKVIKKSFPVIEKSGGKVKGILAEATKEGYNRIKDTLEREIRRISKEKAESRSIEVFTSNLKHLLLTRPVYGRILGVDPGFRNGCKLAAIDSNGRVLYTGIIYPHTRSSSEPQDTFCELIRRFNVKLIAIGNGVASRETEQFVSRSVQSMERNDIYWTIVSEAGASVYSTSKEANKEFPELDASLRGAISIARRLQDPLGELVKVPTKSMGIGMYQHDINQSSLTKALDATVEDCVNFVGVNLNTASVPLLSYVSGISQSQATKIVEYRDLHQAFKSRQELFEVGGIAQKTFTQAAGFLKIPKGKNPLDNTSIHPESYSQTEKLLKKIGFDLKHVADPEQHNELKEKLAKLDIAKLSEELSIGQPTLMDIISDLSKPGLDPRDNLQKPLFRKDIAKESDLKPGMVVCGVVSNVLDFGAFIDIGVGNQLLLHRTDMIAKDGNTRVSDPLQCVELGQVLTLVVKDKDPKATNPKLTLSMKAVPEGKPANLSDQPDVEFKEEFTTIEIDEEDEPVKPAKATKRKAAADEVQEDEPKPKRRKVATKENETGEETDVKPAKKSRAKAKAETSDVTEEVTPKRSRAKKSEPEQKVEQAVVEETKPKRGQKKVVEDTNDTAKVEEDQAASDKPKRGRPKKSVQ